MSEEKKQKEEELETAHEVAAELLQENPDKHGETLYAMYNKTRVPEDGQQELADAFIGAGYPVPAGLQKQIREASEEEEEK